MQLLFFIIYLFFFLFFTNNDIPAAAAERTVKCERMKLRSLLPRSQMATQLLFFCFLSAAA